MGEERIPVSREEAESEDFEERKGKKRGEGWEFEPRFGAGSSTFAIAGGAPPEADIVGHWVRRKKG